MYKEIKTFDDLPKIIAVDFDGTLVTDKFPSIGEPNLPLMRMLTYMRQKHGVKLILWTSRDYSVKYGDLLEDAVEFCASHGLEFDAINENIREAQILTGGDTRKVYADIYLDDKNVSVTQDPLYWSDRVGVPWRKIMDGHATGRWNKDA